MASEKGNKGRRFSCASKYCHLKIFIILVGVAWFSKAISYLQRILRICYLNVICANIVSVFAFYKISTCSFKSS